MANSIAVLQKDITDQISGKLSELEQSGLQLPSNYNAQNALKSAFFKLQTVKAGKNQGYKPALEVCSKASIANSLLDMVTQGLSPAKTQCYFVVYGNELQLQRSYFGTQAVLKRLTGVEDIWANVIFEGDDFDYEIKDGRERLVKHDTHFTNRDNPIQGAYAVVKTEDDEILTVMTKKEIDASWSQAKTNGVQDKFPAEMAKRTVINRAAKNFINTSDDSDLLVDSINRTTEAEYENDTKRKEAEPVQEETTASLLEELNQDEPKVSEQIQEDEPEISQEAQELLDKAEKQAQRKEAEQIEVAKDDEQGELFKGRTIDPNE